MNTGVPRFAGAKEATNPYLKNNFKPGDKAVLVWTETKGGKTSSNFHGITITGIKPHQYKPVNGQLVPELNMLHQKHIKRDEVDLLTFKDCFGMPHQMLYGEWEGKIHPRTKNMTLRFHERDVYGQSLRVEGKKSKPIFSYSLMSVEAFCNQMTQITQNAMRQLKQAGLTVDELTQNPFIQ